MDWWEDRPEERYWCEITDREQIGDDLYTPQASPDGHIVWHYSLITAIRPGDIVFHYKEATFLGASVAGGPIEEKPITWTPRVVRRPDWTGMTVPGWRLPLFGIVKDSDPLTLEGIRESTEDTEFIRNWIRKARSEFKQRLAVVFQLYPGKLRANEAYLAKVPAAFVDHFEQLRRLADQLSILQDRLDELNDVPALSMGTKTVEDYKPLRTEDYWVQVQGGLRRQTRRHQEMMNGVASFFAKYASVSSPFPFDLLVDAPTKLLIEGKTVKRSPLLAVREAVGQLLEYQHFSRVRHPHVDLCICLDAQPDDPTLVEYVEQTRGMMLLWWDKNLRAGPQSRSRLAELGIQLPGVAGEMEM